MMRVSNHVFHVISATGLYHRKAIIESLEYSPNHGHRNTTCLAGDRSLELTNGCWFVSITPVLQIAPEEKI